MDYFCTEDANIIGNDNSIRGGDSSAFDNYNDQNFDDSGRTFNNLRTGGVPRYEHI